MDRRLLRPKWLLAHVAVLALAVAFVFLGLWQLSRHDERVAFNELGERRLSAEPVELSDLVESATSLESIEYRRAVVTGEYDPMNEVLIRSQVHLGTAGFHVITPLVRQSGDAVLVNRGWVPLGADEVPVSIAPPPEGLVSVEGWVELTEERQVFGPEDPTEGRASILSRVDVERIGRQLPMDVTAVYLVAMRDQGSGGNDLPAPVRPPDFDDQGPHLAYAIQWFGFAIVGLVGYFYLAKRRLIEDGPRG